jgi:putative flippase GtrA
VPSLISFLLIGCLVFSWTARVFDPLPALVFSGILLLTLPCLILARLSTPDGLSNLILFYCFYRLRFNKADWVTGLLLLVSLLIRLDNLIAVLVLLSLLKSGDSRRFPFGRQYIVRAFIACGLAFCVNYFLERDFWWFTRITYVQSPGAYGRQLLIYFWSVSGSFLPLLLLFFFLVVLRGRLRWGSLPARLLAGIGIILLIRFLLFPSFEERFNTAFCLTGFLLLLESMSGPGRAGPGPLRAANAF